MKDCRTECGLYQQAAHTLRETIAKYWSEREFEEMQRRGTLIAELSRLNSIGILTDEEFARIDSLLPNETTTEQRQADQERIVALGMFAVQCPGHQYAVPRPLGFLMGSERSCPQEELWNKFVK